MINTKLKDTLVQILKIGFSLGLIFWLIHSGKLDLSKLSVLLSPLGVSVGLLLALGNLILTSERWRLLVRSQGGHLKSTTAFRLTLIGIFFNFSMPGGVGGDLIKGYYFDKENPGKRALVITSVLFDRVLGLFSMVLMAVSVLYYDFAHVSKNETLLKLFYFFNCIFVAFVVGLGLVFSKKLHQSGVIHRMLNHLPLAEKFHKLYENLNVYGKSFRVNLYTVLISLVSQTFSVLFLYFVGILAGFTEVPLKTYFLVAPLGFMITAIPISPAGIGMGQAAFLYLFNLYLGQETSLGPTVITAQQMTQLIFGMAGAFFYLAYKKKQPLLNPS